MFVTVCLRRVCYRVRLASCLLSCSFASCSLSCSSCVVFVIVFVFRRVCMSVSVVVFAIVFLFDLGSMFVTVLVLVTVYVFVITINIVIVIVTITVMMAGFFIVTELHAEFTVHLMDYKVGEANH